MDTPEFQIDKEFKWNNPKDLDYDKFAEKFLYENVGLEDKYRIKVFEIERNDKDIEKIKLRVAECQEYINQLVKELN